ncbi:hypothetical protein SUGI_0129810 [Cryptomeria japonica]|nr:hypothetical protein SUGI_0129810 [Cryptomeria japonica]
MYEAKGLSSTAASHQAILDLQKVLSKVVSQVRTSPTRRNEAFKSDINTRLAILEMKVDSKPGIGQMLGLQVAATAIVQTAPHVFRAVGNMWSSVRNSTK